MSDLSPSHKFDFEVPATQEEAIPLQNSPRKTPTQGASREIPIQGASREKTPSYVDLKSMSDDDGDLGYVDIDDFVQLQTRFDALSKSHDHLNQNVTMLTELLTNFIKINLPPEEGHVGHAHGSTRPFVHAGTSSVVPPPHALSTHAAPPPHAPSAHATSLPPSSSTHAQGMQGMQGTHMNMQGMHDINMVSADVPAKETLEVLKNLTPPMFKGEDNEQNKDTVDTFLSKWGEIHQMRGTSDKKKPLHTCLSLEGKAYKWWMAFKPHKKPNTWASFERAFRNEFLPSDEKQRNWRAWDYCRQKYCTLNQYVSMY